MGQRGRPPIYHPRKALPKGESFATRERKAMAHRRITGEVKQIFLRVLAKTGSVVEAARTAGYKRQSFQQHRDKDPYFAREWAEAYQMFIESLEVESVRRGRDGYEQPVYQGGKEVGTIRKYSDRLLSERLSAELPEKYKTVKVAGDEKHPLVLEARITLETRLENALKVAEEKRAERLKRLIAG